MNSASSSDHAFIGSRPSGGTPSISAMTITGSGYAKSPITSMVPRSITAASSASTIASIRGRRRSTARDANAVLMNPRSRVWVGGSLKTTQRPAMRPSSFT